jgi:diguanylate cyclase (GGDEF)-like protein
MMKRKIRLYWLPILVILLLVVWVFAYGIIPVEVAMARQGQLDLTGWDEQSVIELDGEWQYFNQVMIKDLTTASPPVIHQVPDLWDSRYDPSEQTYGFATYRLVVSNLDPAVDYALMMLDEVSAYRLLINGREIVRDGVVSNSAAGHVPGFKKHVGIFRADPTGKAEFLLEISNYSYNVGGFWNDIKIGRASTLIEYSGRQEKNEIVLFTATIILGLFILALYSINPKLKSGLYFAVICILSALRILLKGNHQFYSLIYDIPWDLAIRLEFIAGYLLLPAYGLFIYHLGYVRHRQWIPRLFQVAGLALTLLTILTPNHIYGNILPYYSYLAVASLVYVIFVMVQGLRRHKSGAILMMLAFAGLIPCVLIDIYANLEVIILPYAIFYMLIIFAIMIIRNFFEIRQTRDRLAIAITTDPLTGLYNRFYINQLMHDGLTVLARHQAYILFFDLDKFKAINDTYGHEVGDGVLIESARRIRACFRADDQVCRYGGDEFIVFAQVDPIKGSIYQLIDRVKESFIAPVKIGSEQFPISLSIGISEYLPGDNLEKTIRESDEAMYEAKKSKQTGIFLIHDQHSGQD